MKLPPEGARWLVGLRFWACAAVFLVSALGWSLGVVADPWPLFAVAAAILAYNVLFKLSHRDWASSRQSVERNILLQILFDLASLTLLLYFADLPRNPFLSFYVFHMIIAGMYLHGFGPYVVCSVATSLVAGVMLCEWLGALRTTPLH